MAEERKFLGKFPIINSGGYELYRRLSVFDTERKYTTDIIAMADSTQREFQISSAISHEGIDSALPKRANLIRDIYNTLIEKLKSEKPNGKIFSDNLLDLAFTEKVLPPRFYFSMAQQGSLREYKDFKSEKFAGIYADLIERICKHYSVENIKTQEDFLHEERIILPVKEGYTFELTKPTTQIETFEIQANNEVEFEFDTLYSLSCDFANLVKLSFGDKIKIYDDISTNCHFYINLDISVMKRLAVAGIERFLLA